MNQIFQGLKVVELTSVLAGPSVGMFFAELGAEVIKIENSRTGGDVTRNWKAASENPHTDTSAYYKSINWGKTSKLLDLSHEDELNVALGDVASADVVLCNFKPGSAKKLQLDFAGIRRINPTVIYANLVAWSETDDRPGFDVLLQAETGFLHMSGQPGGPPAKMPVALIDLLAAHQMKEAILIALLKKAQTGKGAEIRVSMARSAIASLVNQASNYLNNGWIPGKMGTAHPNICPYGDVLVTSDDQEILLAVGTEAHFQQLCRVLQIEPLCADERFSTNAARVKHREELIPLLRTEVGKHPKKGLLQQLHAAKVPAGQIRNMQEVFEMPIAENMVLPYEDGSRCVSSIGFEILLDDAET